MLVDFYSVCYKKLQSPNAQPIVLLSLYPAKHSVVSSSQSPPTTGFDRYFMRYAHTLLFDCPECNLPIAVSRICLGGQFKSGQVGSVQNRPTEVARNC